MNEQERVRYNESLVAAVEQGEYTCPQCDGNDEEIAEAGEYDLTCGCCGWKFRIGDAERRRHGWPGTGVE